MLIAVVSDTHGQTGFTLEAIHEIERRDPSLVLHCGDIGSPAVVHLFAGRETRFVLGNVDERSVLRPAIDDAGLVCDDEFGEVTLADRRVAFLHGHDQSRLRETIRSGQYDLVCHGHTHRQRWELVNATWVLNPGAVFRASPHSIAFVTLPEMSNEFVALPGDRT